MYSALGILGDTVGTAYVVFTKGVPKIRSHLGLVLNILITDLMNRRPSGFYPVSTDS